MRALLVAFALLAPAVVVLAADAPDALLVTSGPGASLRFEAFDTVKPVLHDLDGDGDLEIVAHNDNNRVYVLDPVAGRVLAELETRHPGVWKVRELNDVAVADLDGNGRPDIVVPNSASWLTRFELDPANSTADALAFRKVWEVKVDPRLYEEDYVEDHPWLANSSGPSMDGGPYLADVDDDGRLEIFVQTDGWPGHYSFDADGQLRWMTSWSDGNSNPWVTDLEDDGRLEAIFATDGGRVFVYDANKGYLKWLFEAAKAGSTPGSISVSPAVADLDGDGRKEIVFGARQAVKDEADPDWMTKQHARFYAVSPPADANGRARILWNATIPDGNPHTYTHPAVLDVDGDGDLDVLTMDWNTIGHKPGDWEETGDAKLVAFEGATGRVLWTRSLESPWNNKDLAVADWDGDGVQEIVLSDPRWGESGISFRDLATGEYESAIPYPDGWGGMRGPVVADVDGDGKLDVVAQLWRRATGCPVERDVGCREGAFWVLRGSGSEAAWSGRFTFDHGTETVYPDAKRPDVARVAVRWQEGATPERPAVVVEANVPVEDVEAVLPERVVDLDPVGDGAWAAEEALPAGGTLEFVVAHALGRTSVLVDVPAAAPPPASADPPPREDAPPRDDAPPEPSPPAQDDAPLAGDDAPPLEAEDADATPAGGHGRTLAAAAGVAALALALWSVRGPVGRFARGRARRL